MDGQCPPSSGTGSELLDAIADFTRRYVVLTSTQADAIALWTAHTHAFDAAEATPYLQITSAEKRSGKSRLLEVLSVLVSKPWLGIAPSEAALFRRIDAERPTLLLDEYDTIFNAKTRDREVLRAILNAGYRKGASVARTAAKGKIEDYNVFCPKALAGIGELPSTLADRSIKIRLKRRADHEQVAPFRLGNAEAASETLKRQLGEWTAENVAALGSAHLVAGSITVAELLGTEAAVPHELDDRAAEGWEPLILLARRAGGTWPERAWDAALALSAGEARSDTSERVRLLADIRRILLERREDRIGSAQLAEALAGLEEAPWGNWGGKPLDPRGLAALLAPYEIKPKGIRIDRKTPKGYERAQFEDAWSRYLPPLDIDERNIRNTSTTVADVAVQPASQRRRGLRRLLPGGRT